MYTSLAIRTPSNAHWQQASKITTLPSAVSSFLIKNSAIQNMDHYFIIIKIQDSRQLYYLIDEKWMIRFAVKMTERHGCNSVSSFHNGGAHNMGSSEPLRHHMYLELNWTEPTCFLELLLLLSLGGVFFSVFVNSVCSSLPILLFLRSLDSFHAKLSLNRSAVGYCGCRN